jgi:ABC-type transport system substrate-binding protein
LITSEDVKWSYEHYRGGSATLLQEKTQAIDIVNNGTVKFSFKEPFLEFPILMGTANVCGAGWVVPAKYYQKVGKDGFVKAALPRVTRKPQRRYRTLNGLSPWNADAPSKWSPRPELAVGPGTTRSQSSAIRCGAITCSTSRPRTRRYDRAARKLPVRRGAL